RPLRRELQRGARRWTAQAGGARALQARGRGRADAPDQARVRSARAAQSGQGALVLRLPDGKDHRLADSHLRGALRAAPDRTAQRAAAAQSAGRGWQGRGGGRRCPPRRWSAACAAAYSCRARTRARSATATPARREAVQPRSEAMATQPAVPPLEQPTVNPPISESTRRILWIVGIYRAVSGPLLLGAALFLDLRVLSVTTPNAFVTAAGLYFLYGLMTFLWVQRDAPLLSLPITLLSLLVGDLFFITLLIYSAGSSVTPLSILLFPQLAASGWLMRTQVAVLHAALTSSVLLMLDISRLLQGQI